MRTNSLDSYIFKLIALKKDVRKDIEKSSILEEKKLIFLNCEIASLLNLPLPY